MRPVTAFVAGSITVTWWPGGLPWLPGPARLLATYKRSPIGVCPYAMPAGNQGAAMSPVCVSCPFWTL